MWFATLFKSAMFVARIGGGTYDRSGFIRNNISTFIRSSYRNYRCICLNYTGYNFKQIKIKNHSALNGEWFF